jgi:CubicO group peptidase (beta-lactamase class C family)
LYLREGIWEETRLLSPDYISAATQSQMQGLFPENDRYGYLWWVSEIGRYRTFYASGFGGQHLFVIPELDVVIVVTSTMDRPHLENKTLIWDWLLSIEL